MIIQYSIHYSEQIKHYSYNYDHYLLYICLKDNVGAVLTRLPPTYEVCGSNPRPCVGKLVVAYRWSAVYGTEP